jgi:uncharacterized protein VirK/YbjX
MGMAENQNLIDQTTELHHTLNNACRKWGAWESRLRYLLKPSLNRMAAISFAQIVMARSALCGVKA